MTLFLVPAYGRDYRTQSAAIVDWKEGKDFFLTNGQEGTYCSIRDSEQLKRRIGIDKIQIRYNQKKEFVTVKL